MQKRFRDLEAPAAVEAPWTFRERHLSGPDRPVSRKQRRLGRFDNASLPRIVCVAASGHVCTSKEGDDTKTWRSTEVGEAPKTIRPSESRPQPSRCSGKNNVTGLPGNLALLVLFGPSSVGHPPDAPYRTSQVRRGCLLWKTIMARQVPMPAQQQAVFPPLLIHPVCILHYLSRLHTFAWNGMTKGNGRVQAGKGDDERTGEGKGPDAVVDPARVSHWLHQPAVIGPLMDTTGSLGARRGGS
ncbi:hypothetical protein L209DRAFT_406846 [Thermothelomyces heterothallicus CBS 203.75]